MRTTTILFVAIGLVLVGVAVTRTPGQQVVGDGACCFPTGCMETTDPFSCLSNGGTYLAGQSCASCPPPPGPTVVGVSAVTTGTQGLYFRILRTWSDGHTDMSFVRVAAITQCNITSSCGPVVIIPGTCPTDVDRNGDTGINDFLTLLGGWGACR